jgi:hypothetical protein
MSSFPLSLPHAFHRAEQLFSDKTVVTPRGGLGVRAHRHALESTTAAPTGELA